MQRIIKVRHAGVEQPGETEEELLVQAAPFMTQSLEHNLQQSWSEEERRRLDAATPPTNAQIDHTNRDHECAPTTWLLCGPLCTIQKVSISQAPARVCGDGKADRLLCS